jgi:hypothetical protein
VRPTQNSSQQISGDLTQKIKWPEHEADQSPESSVKVPMCVENLPPWLLGELRLGVYARTRFPQPSLRKGLYNDIIMLTLTYRWFCVLCTLLLTPAKTWIVS